MFATGRNIAILQNEKPLTDQEESQLKEAFRVKYLQQIKMWYLVQKNSKKRKLIEFLNLAKTHPPVRPRTSMHEMRANDFILRSSTGTIDFRLSFNGRPCSRRNNRERFSSHGIKGDDIFGDTTASKKQSRCPVPRGDSLSKFIAKRLMNEDFAARIIQYADDNYSLLNELQEWVDKKSNAMPVPAFTEPSDINPNVERAFNSRTIREDHLAMTRSSSMRSKIPLKQRVWHPPATAYCDFFGEELKSKIDKPFYPVERTEPFSKFPNDGMQRQNTLAVADGQAKVNKEMGYHYKNIFISKTVL